VACRQGLWLYRRPRGHERCVLSHHRPANARRDADAWRRVSFELGKGRDGRIQALNVAIVGAPKARSNASPWPVFAGLAALGLIAGGALVGYFPRQAGIVSLLASLITFFAYADDKTRASRNTWRTPETTLHLLALCGGWPGALAAQHLLRHKNRKRAFQVTFWGTVSVNVGAMVLWQSVMAA